MDETQSHKSWVFDRASRKERDIISRDETTIMPQAGTSPPLMAIRRAEGLWLEDESGRLIMDLNGSNCHNLGHRHSRIIKAIGNSNKHLAFVPRGLTAGPVVDFAHELLKHWPGGEGRVFMVPGGSAAVELAILLTRAATGRSKIVSFMDSYHGRSVGAISISGARRGRSGRFGTLLPDCLFVPPFWPFQDEPRTEAFLQKAARRSLGALSSLFQQEAPIGALFAETIRNGAWRPPGWYWPEVRELCDRHDVLLVSDEIPTGLGKSGRLFNTMHWDVRPDVTLVGKSLGGAMLPVAAVIASAALNRTGDLDLGYYTHERSPLLASVGHEYLRIVHEGHLVEKAASMESELVEALTTAISAHVPIRHARATGMMLSVDIGLDSEAVAARGARANALRLALIENGIFPILAQGGTLTFSFPLISTPENISDAFARIRAAGAKSDR